MFMSMFNWADWVIVSVIAISSLISLKRGFVKEAMSLCVWIAAFVVARMFSTELAPHLADYIPTPASQAMTAFASLFLITLLLGSFVSYLVSSLIQMSGMTGTDRLLGVLFGAARGVLIVLVFVLFAPWKIPLEQDLWWQQSQLIPYFLSMEKAFYDAIALVSEFFTKHLS